MTYKLELTVTQQGHLECEGEEFEVGTTTIRGRDGRPLALAPQEASYWQHRAAELDPDHTVKISRIRSQDNG